MLICQPFKVYKYRMLFNSLEFCLFLLVFCLVYYLLPGRWSNYVILFGSYLFYGSWDWRFLGLIVASTMIDYAVGLELVKPHNGARRRRQLLAISIVANLGMLIFFKYFNFFESNLITLLKAIGLKPNLQSLHIILPVGISFYTFQTMSYTIDIYRGTLLPTRNFVNFAAFVAFFPQLVAGPIERAADLLPQLEAARKRFPSWHNLKLALWLMLWGYFLKVFMADNLAVMVDDIYKHYATASGIEIILCHYAFAFQILGDFAGYSYIAVGVAQLLNIQLSYNFLFPYFVTNPSTFWKNWHITLSSWLKDYLYIPLGGNRTKTKLAHYRNLMITMILGGLWHGAAWNFVVWGIYQGCLLVGFSEILDKRSCGGSFFKQRIGIFVMFNLTCIGWMIFRVPTVTVFCQMTTNLFSSFSCSPVILYHYLFILFVFAGVPLWLMYRQFCKGIPHVIPFESWQAKTITATALFYLLLTLGNWNSREFIYFQF